MMDLRLDWRLALNDGGGIAGVDTRSNLSRLLRVLSVGLGSGSADGRAPDGRIHQVGLRR